VATASAVSAGASEQVQARDYFFTPSTVGVGIGGTVVFDNLGMQTHTATDGTGMDLYDATITPGDSATYTFTAAGAYRFICRPHVGMTGVVRVPVQVSPAAGGLARRYLIVWAAAPAPSGFLYDVQIDRPGSGWRPWMTGVTARYARIRPHAGAGRYRFRARLRQLGTGQRSSWSPSRSFLAS
jgi:plastocyanin